MNRIAAIALISLGFASASACAQTQVGVSVGIHQPGVYGRIDIGNVPPPVVYAQPILIAPQTDVVHQAPMYLYVPPGHQKHWAKHCSDYNACGQPVYFVQEQWVRAHHDRERHRGHGKYRHRDD
jgi:hypothetical protein